MWPALAAGLFYWSAECVLCGKKTPSRQAKSAGFFYWEENMSDEQFIAAFEAGTLDEFHHKDHIRVAWIYLRKYGVYEGSRRIINGIRNFAASRNQHNLYHETITRFWIRAVAHHIQEAPEISTFCGFCRNAPRLLDSKLIQCHYSPTLLKSDEARMIFTSPDRMELPDYNSNA